MLLAAAPEVLDVVSPGFVPVAGAVVLGAVTAGVDVVLLP
jgi:hypothetical protein